MRGRLRLVELLKPIHPGSCYGLLVITEIVTGLGCTCSPRLARVLPKIAVG
jgi:hypothetical protein